MHTVRKTGRFRRTAAWGVAATLLAVLLPAVPATAAPQYGTATFVSGELKVGKTATFTITCSMQPDSPGATAYLVRQSTGTVRTQRPVMSLTDPANYTYSGQTTFDLTGVTAGTYSIRVDCEDQWGGYVPTTNASGDFQITAADLATTTTLTASATQVVPGEQVYLYASVPGTNFGMVTFKAGSSTLGAMPVSGSQASYPVTVNSSTTFTAEYSGSTGYQASTSSPVTVNVIDQITFPQGYGMGGTPKVGQVSTATVVGDWTPTVQQGLVESYRWEVNNVQVSTAKTYTPKASDQGKNLRLVITGSFTGMEPVSRAIDLTVAAADPIVGSLTLGGAVNQEATLGTTLVAQATGWSPTATLSYQWWSDNQQVGTGTSYTPKASDLGHMVSVELTVTEAGRATLYDHEYVWNVLTTPTVTVGSSTINVGKDAVVPVTVAGPKGGPVPLGAVSVKLTPRAGDNAVTLNAVTLNAAGKASVTIPDLAVGTYTVAATYIPAENHIFARYSVSAEPIGQQNGYRTATGSGTVTVVKPSPTVEFPSTLSVPVATAGQAALNVTSKVRPTEYVVLSGQTELVRGEIAALGSTTVTLPVLAPGTHTLTLVLPETATTAQVTQTLTVTVAGEPDRTGSTPTAKLASPKNATAPGQSMELVADGFLPGETVAFFVHSEPRYLGTAVADENGIARLTAVIPADLPVGDHTVIATGGTSGRWAELPIDLAVPGETAISNQLLATTGSGSGSALAGAWMLLLVGAGLLIVVRRARTVRGAA